MDRHASKHYVRGRINHRCINSQYAFAACVEDSDEAVEVEGSLPVTEQSDLSDWIKSTLGQKVHTAPTIHVLVGRLAVALLGAPNK
jgi:hypothetical protein